jgi:hypothetical protein
MAELTLSCPAAASSTASSATGIDIQKRVLIRTGGVFYQNAILDILNPGTGWVALGDPVTFSGADEFTDLTQTYRNGIHQLSGASASDNNDVYFVAASGSIAFESNVHTNDVVQVWKFNPTRSG